MLTKTQVPLNAVGMAIGVHAVPFFNLTGGRTVYLSARHRFTYLDAGAPHTGSVKGWLRQTTQNLRVFEKYRGAVLIQIARNQSPKIKSIKPLLIQLENCGS